MLKETYLNYWRWQGIFVVWKADSQPVFIVIIDAARDAWFGSFQDTVNHNYSDNDDKDDLYDNCWGLTFWCDSLSWDWKMRVRFPMTQYQLLGDPYVLPAWEHPEEFGMGLKREPR